MERGADHPAASRGEEGGSSRGKGKRATTTGAERETEKGRRKSRNYRYEEQTNDEAVHFMRFAARSDPWPPRLAPAAEPEPESCSRSIRERNLVT